MMILKEDCHEKVRPDGRSMERQHGKRQDNRSMKIENRTPHQDGFYMPGEFEPQDGVILIWPKRPGSWPYEAKEAGKVFAEIANKLAETEKVYMLTEPETEAAARELLCENVEILTIPTDDAWARDVGPTFVTDGKEVRGVNWSFNAWGGTYDGLYQDWQKDDKVAEEFIRDHGAIPTFKGFPNPYGSPFPGTLCTSVNDQVVHGIPNDIPLKDGDIVSVDCGTFMNGFCGDSAYTFCVGEVDPEIVKLLKVTKESLYKGIENAVHGKRLGDIGYSIQEYCEAHSYGVVREFVGHGIGKEMHEDPPVPNYGRRGTGTLLKKGMCIAIEPMITMGNRQIVMEEDRWTIRTRDRKCAAHFEHTVAVGVGKADILSSFEFIEQVLGDKAI